MAPAMERVIAETRLDKFVAPTTRLEELLSAVNREWRDAPGVLTPLFVQKLYEWYKASYPLGEGLHFDKMVGDSPSGR